MRPTEHTEPTSNCNGFLLASFFIRWRKNQPIKTPVKKNQGILKEKGHITTGSGSRKTRKTRKTRETFCLFHTLFIWRQRRNSACPISSPQLLAFTCRVVAHIETRRRVWVGELMIRISTAFFTRERTIYPMYIRLTLLIL